MTFQKISMSEMNNKIENVLLNKNEQQLFLMEFLIDRINIPTVCAMQEEMLPSTTCVSFQVHVSSFFFVDFTLYTYLIKIK